MDVYDFLVNLIPYREVRYSWSRPTRYETRWWKVTTWSWLGREKGFYKPIYYKTFKKKINTKWGN